MSCVCVAKKPNCWPIFYFQEQTFTICWNSQILMWDVENLLHILLTKRLPPTKYFIPVSYICSLSIPLSRVKGFGNRGAYLVWATSQDALSDSGQMWRAGKRMAPSTPVKRLRFQLQPIHQWGLLHQRYEKLHDLRKWFLRSFPKRAKHCFLFGAYAKLLWRISHLDVCPWTDFEGESPLYKPMFRQPDCTYYYLKRFNFGHILATWVVFLVDFCIGTEQDQSCLFIF